MAFVKEPEPPRGVALVVIPSVRRVVAPNPSVMTYHGTNTFLIEDFEEGITVLDPGPSIESHIAAVIATGAGRIRRILISHAHSDHCGASNALREATGAPVFCARAMLDPPFTADYRLSDNDTIADMNVLYTPGHAADHLCFERPDGVVFTADHVMGWASSIVNPPGGDMRDYCDSLERMLPRQHRLYLCGHGPPVTNPGQHVRNLLEHRLRREHAIASTLAGQASGPHSLMERLYSKVDPLLKRAAERNVLAHLIKMQKEGKVEPRGELWHWVGGPVL